MFLGSLTFSSPSWLWPAGAAVALLLVLAAWSYRVGPRSPVRWICAGLRLLGLLALAFCLLEPLWSGQRAKPGANLFAVIADNSQGLRIKDQGGQQSRSEELLAMLGAGEPGWQSSLEENFDVRRFYFDRRLQATRDFRELDFEGRSSAIGAALGELKERFARRPLAGLLLFTDGNATDLAGKLPDLQGLPPIYPVVLGRQSDFCDAAVAEVNVTQTDFEDAPVSLQADVTAAGLPGENLTAQLLDAAGKKIQQLTLRSRKQNDTLAFRFQFRPEKPGVSFYRVNVRLTAELGSSNLEQAPPSREATLLNNTRVVSVDRGRGPYRILYVAGRPNWEYKFLNRAVQEDDQVQLVALIRIARREAKFDFRGRGGETGNPLFRGFGNQAREETERYDQPVLVHLNTRDEMELRGGFPSTAQELFGYQAVILDDVEAEFFTAEQAALLQKFVSERGGGLLMLGGMECFQQGHYQRTPIGDMLPVYLEGRQKLELPPAGPVRLSLTPEGFLLPWVRLRENESDEKTRLKEMPGFNVLNPLHTVKPGAIVVAKAADENGNQYPALVTQRFGRGRTAAFTIGDFWRWGMESPEQRQDFEKAWRQLARWLVTDVPKQIDLSVEPATDSPVEAVNLEARVRTPKFQPLDDAEVSFEVQPASVSPSVVTNPAVRLRAEPSLKEPGLYEAQYVPHGTGGYLARVSVTNSAGVEVGRAEAGWATDLAAEEFRSLSPNVALLQEIARRTGGEIVPAGKLVEFTRNLPARHAPVMEPWTTPAWHTPLIFLFALGCFVAEWGLRRWKGLP